MTHAAPDVLLPAGFRFSAVSAAIKTPGRLDLALAEAPAGATAAALFTKNLVIAAPLVVDRLHLKAARGAMRAVVVNSGNANCATGTAGLRACHDVCRALAKELGLRPREVFPSSTGVIGMPFPAERALGAIPELVAALAATPEAVMRFAQAIMTTDTHPKLACARVRLSGRNISLLGIAKGAGMIHPNMATMLVYLFTDTAAPSGILQRALREACATTFNAISVDGDTSTNDTVLLVASGASGARIASPADRRAFGAGLQDVCASLAEQIVADGEGVRHVVRLTVENARSEAEAALVARAIATSALVKTAWAGADPNWGRILAAVGRAGIRLDPARVSIHFGPHLMCRNGAGTPFDEAAAHAYLSQSSFEVRVTLGRGRARYTMLTCDLTTDYVRINADYRT